MTFGTTIVDPPWGYERTSTHEKLRGYSDGHYEPLSTEALAALPVGEVTANVLLLWTTAPMMPDALRLVDAWGFQYVTQMFWLKASRPPLEELTLFGDQSDGLAFTYRPNYGVGYWVRGNVEPIVIAKKPGTPSYRTPYSSLITKVGAHSEKPDTLYELAEDYFPSPYLEVFARRHRDGWTQLGDDQGLDDPGDIRSRAATSRWSWAASTDRLTGSSASTVISGRSMTT